jgi:hypothetical protein
VEAVMIYEEILKAAAAEAAEAATDAFGRGGEPPAHMAYDFILQLWDCLLYTSPSPRDV